MENKTNQNENIQWSAPEYVYHQKGPVWYVVISGIGIAFISYFLFTKDFLTATLFFLLLLILLYFGQKKPRIVKITLSKSGVDIDDMHISFRQIKSFWLIYEPPAIKTLNFETATYFNKVITVQLANQNPSTVRKFLLEFIPEDLEQEEHITDRLSRKIKF